MGNSQLIITPGYPLKGEVILPGDKSISHRAVLLASIASGESVIDNFLVSGVTEAMLEAVEKMGVAWKLDGSRLEVYGKGMMGLRPPEGPINCRNSATTLRLLAGILAAAGIPVVLDGSDGLRRRPMKRLADPLRSLGVSIETSQEGTAPVLLAGRPKGQTLHPAVIDLPVASAQIKSAVLLAGLAADGPVQVHEPGPSRDHTERMLAGMGISIETHDQTITLWPASAGRPMPLTDLPPLKMSLPGDFSSAAFLIVAGLITPESAITIRGVGLNPTRTGLLDVLLTMGGDIRVKNEQVIGGEPVGDLEVRYSPLYSAQISGSLVVRMIDEFPAFAAAALYARGTSVVSQAEELRTKESDRISALCQELSALGANLSEAPDGFTIHGPFSPHTAGVMSLEPHGDHRLAMAMAVAGLAYPAPIGIQDAGIIAESYPEFTDTLSALGAKLAST